MTTGKKAGFIAGFKAGFRANYTKNRQLFAAKKLNRRQNFKTAYRSAFRTAQSKVYFSYARPLAIAAFSFIVGLLAGAIFNPTVTTGAAEAPISVETTETATVSYAEKAELSRAKVSTLYTKTTTAATATNTTGPTLAPSLLSIPSIGLSVNVSASALSAGELSVPASGVSVYGNLLMGHVTGTFAGLSNVQIGQKIGFNNQTYVITAKIVEKVSDDRRLVGAYNTNDLAFGDSLVLMTCAGSYRQFTDGKYTYSHRLLVFAKPA